MMTMKFSGVLITGLAAFLLTNKALNVIDNSTKRLSEASKWKNYYKCWSKGQATSEPIAPGYSVTSSSGMGDTDGDHIIKDPYGKDHSVQSDKNRDLANAIVEACKGAVEKSIDSLKKPSETRREASEGQTEASESDISKSTDECKVHEIVTEVDDDGNPVAGRYSWKETSDDETVD